MWKMVGEKDLEKRKRNFYISCFIEEVIISATLTIIIDFNLKTFATILLMLRLNIFAIPIAFIFPLPLWAWYVIVFVWFAEILNLIKLDKEGENQNE